VNQIGFVNKILLVVALATPFASGVLAQVPFSSLETASEAELLEILSQTDRQEIGRVYIALGRIVMDRDPHLARKHLQLADAYVPAEDNAGRGYLDATWCWLHIIFSDLAKAEQKCISSLALAESGEDAWARSKAYNSNTVLYFQTGQLRQAYEHGLKALDAAMLVGRVTVIANQYNALGLITRAQGQFQTALDYFASGLALLDLQEHEEMFRVMSFNVGLAYADLGQYEIAQDYYAGSLQWAVANQRYAKELTALVYNAMADNALGHADKVVGDLTAALVRPEMRENLGYLAFAYAVLGEAYLQLEDHEAALRAFEQGRRIAVSDPNTFEQRKVNIGYAKALHVTGNNEQARKILSDSIKQLRSENARTVLLQALDLLGDIEESQGNYAAALTANKEAAQIARDFQQQAVENELAILRKDFELNEAASQLAQAQRDNIVRNGVIMLVLGLGFIGYLGVSRRAQRQRAEAEAKHAEHLELVVAERTRELQKKIEQANISESARIALERQLAEAEKLRVLGQLTGGVAHDFNNLLTVVIGAAELLKDAPEETQINNELIDHIITAASSGADITRALMAYARKQPLQLETVILNDLLRERIPLVARTLGGMVKLNLQIDECPELKVVLDASQLTSALLNLTLNARDAQDNQGEVLISLTQRDGRWAVISVVDQGCGMTPDQMERAAEPFFTTKAESQGNGLGLSMVYGFSKQLGGDLEIDSQVGKGTQVRIVLPLAHLADTRVHEVDFSQGKS
jgi:signal transduction histidine kinase